MAETSSVASHVLKPCDKVDGAPANGIELQSRIAAFSHQSLADSIAKCLAEVSDLNSDLGSRLSELVGDLISGSQSTSSLSVFVQALFRFAVHDSCSRISICVASRTHSHTELCLQRRMQSGSNLSWMMPAYSQQHLKYRVPTPSAIRSAQIFRK